MGFFALFQILKDYCWHFTIKHGVCKFLADAFYCVKDVS